MEYTVEQLGGNQYIASFAEAQLPNELIFPACDTCGELTLKGSGKTCRFCQELENNRRYRLHNGIED